MKIAVAGTGYVGLVTGVALANIGHNVTCVDVDENKIKLMQKGISPIYENDLENLMQKNKERLTYTTNYQNAYKNADVIIIGVGTPERADGSANLDYVFEVAKQIAESVENDCVVVVKSTVPIGTNDKVEKYLNGNCKEGIKISVASNPEFLAQGTAVRDTLFASRIVIGAENEKAKEILSKMYEPLTLEPYNVPLLTTNRRSAEMIKYASNDFLALKISYMNDIANLCELVGANIQDVAKGMSYDPRIGANFLNAGIGYGGSCFPKDTKALKYLAKQHGYKLKTVEAAVDVNAEQKVKLFKKASERMITFNGVKIAILGLTFKPGTDDLREAPSIDNVELLLKNNANNIYAYDPVGEDNFKKRYPTEINYVSTPEEALKDANICFIFTEWNEIKAIKPEMYKKLMKTPLVYDGRNIYDVKEMKDVGIEYYSIGR